MEETKVLTIVFTDIKGFTERTSHSNREAVSKLLEKHEELLLPLVGNYDGTLVKTIGDAFLLTFPSPTNAILCSIMMQEKLKEFNAEVPEDEKIEIRIAINTGEVILRDGDIFGEPVNIAARIEALTDANEIWFSESTYLAMNKQEAPTSLVGEYRLKGIPEAVRIYHVIRDENDETYKQTVSNQLKKIASILPGKKVKRSPIKSSRTPYFIIFAVLVIALIIFTRESATERQLRLAQEAQAQKNFRGAITHLEKIANESSSTNKILKILTPAINEQIKQKFQLAENKEATIAELEAFLSDTKKKFPILDSKLLKAEIDLTIAKAHLFIRKRKRKEADNLLDGLARRANQDTDILFEIGKVYERYGYNWTRTIKYLHAAAKQNPKKYAQNSVVLGEFEWFLNRIEPSDGYEEIRKFIADNCYDHFSKKLIDSLYKHGKDFHAIRWNAKKILSGKDHKIDLTRFYLTDLFTSPGPLKSDELKEAVEYFKKNQSPALGTQIETNMKELPKKFPIVEKLLLKETDRPLQLVAGPFFPHLQTYLHGLLEEKNMSPRFNAFKILKMRRDLSPIEEWKFSARNVCDFRWTQWSAAYYPTLIESLDYLIKADIPKGMKESPESKKLGNKTLKAVKAMLEQELKAIKEKKPQRFFKESKREQRHMESLIAKLEKSFIK
jgi:class 3 adenylate cyclase